MSKMKLEENVIYHCFNQGNNREYIFYNEENYIYFLNKIKKFWLPHIDVLAFCLMPNHFHFLLIPIMGFDNSKFKKDLATSLRSYTRAINKQQNRSGSLFREGTKFKDGVIDKFITSENSRYFYGGENNYAAQCFEYIHQNPVIANLVMNPFEYQYSSYNEYFGTSRNNICNLELGKQIFLL